MRKHVIEFNGLPVGILVPANGRFRFIAVKFHVMDLDGQSFRSPTEVKRAIGALINRR